MSLNNQLPRGKKVMKSRQPYIDKILSDNNCYMDWNKNENGYLFVLTFEDNKPKIEKQFDKKPYNIYNKVNLFYDFVETTFNKKAV